MVRAAAAGECVPAANRRRRAPTVPPPATSLSAMTPIARGLKYLARGVRTGNAGFAGLGAALAAYGWLKRRARPKRELLYARTLKRGDALRISLLGPERNEEIEVAADPESDSSAE